MEAEKSVRIMSNSLEKKMLQPSNQNLTNDSGYNSDIFMSPEANDTFIRKVGIKTTNARRSLSSSTPRCEIKAARSLECLSPKSHIAPLNIEDSQISDLDIASPISSDLRSKSNEDISSTSRHSKLTSNALRNKDIHLRTITSGPILRNRRPQNILVRMLNEADYLVQALLRYLPAKDLLRLSHVNRQLRHMILGHKVSNMRRLSYIHDLRKEREHQGQENFRIKRLPNEAPTSNFLPLSPRKALSELQNQQRRSPKKQPPSPIRTLSQRFIEEGRVLAKDEELQKCVKCKSPARVQKSALRAICSKTTCAYDYCTRCHLPAHRKPQDCPSLKTRPRNSKGGIFSEKCKRNLRRL